MVRSVILRGFDQQMANLVGEEMKTKGVHFIHQAKPKAVEKQEDGKLLVHWVDKDGQVHQDVYDTVLFAIGRQALTRELKPENVGLKLVPETFKIDAVNEQTNIPNIYAVGDVLHVSRLTCFIIIIYPYCSKFTMNSKFENLDMLKYCILRSWHFKNWAFSILEV